MYQCSGLTVLVPQPNPVVSHGHVVVIGVVWSGLKSLFPIMWPRQDTISLELSFLVQMSHPLFSSIYKTRFGVFHIPNVCPSFAQRSVSPPLFSLRLNLYLEWPRIGHK